MCGLTGWLSPRGEVDAEALARMREAMAHRGPDGAGQWVAADRRVGLAHRRLSIVDLSPEADQPMWDALGEVVVVYNGEIYNHVELRRDLVELGFSFRTSHSDTEVLVVGYRAWGLEGLLRRLNGAFAFALLDRAADRLFLVRDRVGIKPLYVARAGADLLFASEAKALFASGRIRAQLDRESFVHYLGFRSVPAPGTLFEGVECLEPGGLIELDQAGRELRRASWWDPLGDARTPPKTEAQAADRLEELLRSAVDLRMRADVPVGLFLSGGVDSAWLLGRMAATSERLNTFTVHYPGHDSYDESSDAAELARRAGSAHHPVPVSARAYGDSLAEVAWFQDEPIAAPVCPSVYFLAQAARSAGVPVALAGEGADELFVGYRSWIRLRDLQRWDDRLPDLPGRWLRRGAAALAGALLPETAPQREILRRAAAGQPLFWGGALDFGQDACERLLGPAVGRPAASTFERVVRPLRDRFLERGDPADLTGWMSYADLRFRLPQLMLPRLDKMGLAFSVEGRVPYLDHRVVELVMGLPPAWRAATGGVGKPLLKRVMCRSLPRAFVYRQKRGFQAPVAEWKEGELGGRWGPLLIEFARRTALFEPAALERLLARSADRLWFNLANFALWYCTFVENVLPESLDGLRAARGFAGAREGVHVA